MKMIWKSKAIVFVMAVVMTLSMFPLLAVRTQAEENDKPLDFVTNPESARGEGWSWDKDTATLTLNDFSMDLSLSGYSEDYDAGILLPDASKIGGNDQVTLVLENDSYLGVSGKNTDGDYRLALICCGNLEITGSGTLSVLADDNANGIEVHENLLIGSEGDPENAPKIAVLAENYAIGARKELVITGGKISATTLGTDTTGKVAKGALIGANMGAAEYGVDISNAEIEAMIGGDGSSGLMCYDGKLRMSGVKYTQFAESDSKESEGIASYNGDVIINDSLLDIQLGTLDETEGKQDILIAAYKNLESPHPADKPEIQIDKSVINGHSRGEGLYGYYGGVSVSDSTVDVTAVGHAVFAGSKGLSIAGSTASLVNTGNYFSDAVNSGGSVSISDSKVNLEGNGKMCTALMMNTDETPALTVSGKDTVLEMQGTYTTLRFNVKPTVTEAPMILGEGLSVIKGGTMQYVDLDDTGSVSRNFTYSEGTLEVENNQIKNASTSALIGNAENNMVTLQPVSQKVSYPKGASFRVEVLHPEMVKSYQWICTDIAGNEFVLNGTSAATPELIIPSTDASDQILTYRCEITGTDGSVIVSNNATLDLDNREETKTVFYVREYALEQGQSLDLSTVGLGSGTISLSEDASTVRMNQVKFDNSGHNVYDDVLIPAISLMLDTNNNEKESYHIQLVGENVINNTFTSPEGNGISLMLSSRDEVVTPKFIFESGSEDPAGTLTLYGGTRGISAEGGEVVLDADVHVARHQQEEHQYDFLDGIVGDAVTVKAGRTIDLKVNGAGFSVTGGLAIGENAKVTIDTVAPRINGGNLGTAPEGIIHVYNSANGQAALRNDYIPGSLRSVLGNGGEEEQGGTVMTYKAAIFAGGGVVSLAPGSDVTITGSGKPETKAKIGGFAGIMLQNGAALEADSAALGINMSADPGEEIYATNFSCINGGDNGNVTFKNSEVDLGISSDSIYNGCGILTNGDVDIEDSFVGAMISVHGDIYGIAPEGALTVKDSTVFSLSQSYEEESINYGVCAGELHMSFAGENQGLLARAENKDGIAILVKNGKGNKPVGYDPDYKAKKIILTDDIGITAPEDYAINQTSIKGSLSPWLYMETVYDKQDTTKPSNAVLFEYQKSLADAAVTISPKKFIYDGTKKTPRVVRVVLDGKELIENLDYTVSYKNNIKAGTGEVIVTGRGSYKDSVKQSFTINAKKLTDSNVKLKKTSYPYTGSAINAPVIVKDGTKTLKEGVDYNVKYTNNKNAGTGEVIVTGRGNYKDSVKLTFTITAKKLTNSNVKLKKTSYPYTGSAIKAPVIVKDGTKTLKEGVDYKVRYTNNKNAGTAKATVTGINNYQGAVTKNFTITKAANGITKFAPTSKTLKYNKIKSQTIQLKAAARFGTKVAFEKASVTPAKASTYFTVSKAGKVTVKKGTPRGTYTLKVKVTSAGTKNYAAKTVTKSIKITVK